MKRDLYNELMEGFDALANEQAALLFKLVRNRPKMIRELQEIR